METNREKNCKACSGMPEATHEATVQNFKCTVCTECLEVVNYSKEVNGKPVPVKKPKKKKS